MNHLYRLWKALRNKEERDAFVVAELNVGIPFQIRALMKRRGWTQQDLAARTKTKQSRISDLLSPGKTKPTISTLLGLCSAFDCALLVKFVPFSELAEWSEKFQPDDFQAVPFGEDSPPEAAMQKTGGLAVSRSDSMGIFIVSGSRAATPGASMAFSETMASRKPVVSETQITAQSVEVM